MGVWGLGIILGFVVLVFVIMVGFYDRILPGVVVGNTEVGGMRRWQAKEKIVEVAETYVVSVTYNQYVWEVPSDQLKFSLQDSTTQAYMVGRTIKTIWPYIKSLPGSYVVGVSSGFDFDGFVASISSSVSIPPIPASLIYEDDDLSILDGEDGLVVEEELLKQRFFEKISLFDVAPVDLPTAELSLSLSSEEELAILSRAFALLESILTIEVDDEVFTLSAKELLGFLNVRPRSEEVFSSDLLREYVVGIADVINRPAQDARFQVENDRVVEFVPDRDGYEVVVDDTVWGINNALIQLLEGSEATSAAIIVARTSPKIQTSDANSLGIVERLGRGESYYRGSILPRVHNVELTARKLDGTLVAPGEEFSFNGTIGDISKATGFVSAYIIQNGRTVLGDGGGVCQDSTTMFRAAMNAGFPITERWAHSYRVGYYEQNSAAGFDATVYAPSKDFKFLNDTNAYILIDTIYDSAARHLIIDIYGTPDGRISYVSDARVWDITPPPPPLYQDDASLAPGEIKQVDWSAWGAKSSFDYSVVKNGETIFSKSYYSAYRPWQDVYLRGVTP